MTDRSGETNFDEPRNLSGPERTMRFLPYKAQVQPSDTNVSTRKTNWHLIDDADMTPDQYDEIPTGAIW